MCSGNGERPIRADNDRRQGDPRLVGTKVSPRRPATVNGRLIGAAGKVRRSQCSTRKREIRATP